MSNDDIKLIYQPVPPDGADKSFASALEAVLATSEVIAIASPYLSFDVLRPLVEGRSFRIVTDQDACLGARVEASLVDFFEHHSASIRSLSGLHAKVVLGAHAGLLGSANMTTTGLCRRFEMACVVRGSRFNELEAWFDALWENADPLDLEALAIREAEAAGSEQDSPSTTKSLTTTGRLGWLRRERRAEALPDLAAGGTGALSESGGVSAHDLEELGTRLRELTEDRTTAGLVLEMLAQALEHAGLPVDDERLHLNFGRPKLISVTLGQRHVAWCQRKGAVREFGMMLQSFDVADRGVAAIPGARQDAFTKNKTPVLPDLYVPLEALGSLDPSVLSDWEQSIRREVLECSKSSYLSKKREALYHILVSPSLRTTAVRLAHPSSWWFGVNNGSVGHMTLEEVAPLFEGSQLHWPFGNSKTLPRNAYAEMLPDDRVLVWTGHGRDGRWGVIGTAKVACVNDDHVLLNRGTRFEVPLSPYPRRQPAETEAVKFLLGVFGGEFKPLGDVRQAIYGAGRTNPITIAKVTETQADQVVDYARQLATQ